MRKFLVKYLENNEYYLSSGKGTTPHREKAHIYSERDVQDIHHIYWALKFRECRLILLSPKEGEE